jgi:glycosyltransferase involved in cell wall biosynthesis
MPRQDSLGVMKSICLLVQNVYDFDPRVRRKAEALVAAGYSVDVLSLRPASGRKKYSLNGVTIQTVALGKERGSRYRYFFEYMAFFLWALVRVTWQMLRRRYALIDVNSLPDFLIFAPVVARWMGAKLVLDLHEITPEFYMSKYGVEENSRVIRVMKYLEAVSIAFADHVITINEPIQDLLSARGLSVKKSTVVMNAVDEGRFAVAPALAPAPGQGGSSKFVMMYHGTLTKIYGLDIAIEAFAQAHRKMPGAELWILGSGSEQKVLGALADKGGVASKVRLIGQVASSEIPAWLNQCDAGILPIRRDVFLDFAFPNKLPEFIIMGKPVIVSRLKAIRHYFNDGSLAYFEPNNAADMASQMMRLYQDRELRTELALKAKSEYAPICWAVMRQRYLALVENLAGGAVTWAAGESQIA